MPTIIRRILEASDPQMDIIESRQQINLFLAAQAAGKSFIGGVVSAQYIIKFPKCHGFIGANTHSQLSDSTLFRIRQVWKEYWGWTEWTKENPSGIYVVQIQPPPHFNTEDHSYTTYRGKICFKNGTVVYIGSLANYEAHEGKEFAWAILDETKDTKEEAVKEVITGRLREAGMYVDGNGELCNSDDIINNNKNKIVGTYTPLNPLYILTSPAKVQWINEWFKLDDFVDEIVEHIYSETDYFLKDIDNKRVTISSVFHNKANLPSTFIPNQRLNLNSGQQDMLIYGNPFSSSGGEFYKAFGRTKHVIDVRKVEGFNDVVGNRAYNPDIALHISFDFNVNPFNTLTIYQIVGKKIYQIDEICLTSPDNRTENVCREFIRRYQGHNAGLFVYGDPSGKAEDTKTEKGQNNFWIIMRTLADFKPKQRVLSKAPAVSMRGNFINRILEGGFEDMEIWVHNTCAKSIADFVYLKEASDGNKLKEKVKNEDTGVTYEKYGHCFVGNTMIVTDKGEKRIDQIEKGDMVLTRKGYKPVIRIWDNGFKDVYKFIINDHKIICTPNHMFWTEEYGFKEIGKLVLPATVCVYDAIKKEMNKTKLSFLYGEKNNIKKVYDITVADNHEYFANGILVHNCSDSFDYMICYAFASEYSRYQKGGVAGAAPTSGRSAASKSNY